MNPEPNFSGRPEAQPCQYKYRRHRLNGKIHIAGGCPHSYGRWTDPWPEADQKWPVDIIDDMERDHCLRCDAFCYFCFGRTPNFEIYTRLGAQKLEARKKAVEGDTLGQ